MPGQRKVKTKVHAEGEAALRTQRRGIRALYHLKAELYCESCGRVVAVEYNPKQEKLDFSSDRGNLTPIEGGKDE